jgi:membrane associated rhomboid family serine protease
VKVSTATHILIAACVVVFFNLEPRPGFYQAFICSPSRLAAGAGYYTLITSLFSHAGVTHLIVNAVGLWAMSWGLERLGGFRYLTLFIVGGALSHLSQALWCIAFGFPSEGLQFIAGASGGLAAVIGAQLALYPARRVTVFVFGAERQMLFAWGVAAWALGEVVAACLPGMKRAWVAHLAGLAFGFALARLLTITKPRLITTERLMVE